MLFEGFERMRKKLTKSMYSSAGTSVIETIAVSQVEVRERIPELLWRTYAILCSAKDASGLFQLMSVGIG